MKKVILVFLSYLLALLPLSFFSFVLPVFLKKRMSRSRDYAWFKKNVAQLLKYEESSPSFEEFRRQNLEHFCLALGETLKVCFLKKEIKIEGEKACREKFKKMTKEGGGSCIVATAHLGVWDLLGFFFAKEVTGNIYALAKPSRSPWVQAWLTLMREGLGVRLLHTGKGNFQRELLKVLGNGSSVIFLMDQKPHHAKGLVVDFLGQKTEFVKGPAYLAKKYKKPILLSFLVRRGDYHYEMVSEAIPIKTVLESSLEELTGRLASGIGKAVWDDPKQWVWSYKRWDDDKEVTT